MAVRSESELYVPVKKFLAAQGYTVRAEVNDCDIAATREDDMLIVELKSTFSLTLVLQGIERQTVTDNVFLAVEAPRKGRKTGHWRDIVRLCGRLGLGLLFVHFLAVDEPEVEVVREPNVAGIRRNKRKKALLKREFDRRSGDYNIGGSARDPRYTPRPTVTAYREDALRIARYLQEQGTASPKQLRTQLGSKKVDSILQKNYYGWFDRVERGVYALSTAGAADLALYNDVATEPAQVQAEAPRAQTTASKVDQKKPGKQSKAKQKASR